MSVVRSVRELIAQADRDELTAMAIDIPIGLPDRGRRACDVEARARLGPRRSSVFPAPVRAVLRCPTWDDANTRARAIDGRGLPRQAFNLLGKIAEVDALMSPRRQRRIVEAHPELSFASMSGAPLGHPKRSPAGRQERIDLVRVAPARLSGAAPDDVLDAHAALWTARRVAVGAEVRLGDGARDRRGLQMEIVY